MSKKIKYKTIQNQSDILIVEKKSKFIGNAFPVDNEEDALAYLNEIKKKYPDATHHVYAYVIDENNIFRYSDDGEPSGTAGMPVLDTIRKENLVDVLVVVTRYFGGTLLGTGGLVHAYGASAHEALKQAKIVTRCLCNVVSVRADYTMSGRIQHKITTDGYIIENIVYDDAVTFYVCTLPETTEKFIADITDITNGKVRCKVENSKYIDRE